MAGSTSAAVPSGAPIPGGLLVQAREPLDSKYWVSNYAGLATGLTYSGILRFDTSTNKLYINLAGTWTEIPTSASAASYSFNFGAVTTGTAAVTNTGTTQNPILNFTVPQGIQGTAATIGMSVTASPDSALHITNTGNTNNAQYVLQIPAGATGPQGPQFTINAVGSSTGRTDYNATSAIGFTYLVSDPSAADDGKYYVYQGSSVWSSPVPFKGPTGKSVYIAYAETYDGTGRTFIQGAKTIFISFLSGTVQPSINAFSLWSPISGPAGTGGSSGPDATKLTKSGDTITGDILNTSKGFFQNPVGLNTDRPSVPQNGMRRFNIDTGRDEFYAAGAWQNHARLSGDTFSGAITASNLSGTNTGDETTARINTLYGYTPANAVTVVNNTTAITAEAATRATNDTALQNNITTISSALAGEGTARASADTALQTSITANTTSITNEVTARTAADVLKADLVNGRVPNSQLPAGLTYPFHIEGTIDCAGGNLFSYTNAGLSNVPLSPSIATSAFLKGMVFLVTVAGNTPIAGALVGDVLVHDGANGWYKWAVSGGNNASVIALQTQVATNVTSITTNTAAITTKANLVASRPANYYAPNVPNITLPDLQSQIDWLFNNRGTSSTAQTITANSSTPS